MPHFPPKILAVVLLLAGLPLALHARKPDPLVVKTLPGKIQGVLTPDGQVRAFLGIPYAQPPVDQLRWKAPQPVARWKGVRPATAFGPHCMQFGAYPDMVFHDPGPNEDCLTLNVWAPTGAKPGSLPVMVWIHGGGFQTGGSSEQRQDGQVLAHRNVVVVSMNYRLGVFGFFSSSELAEESGHNASGNYGLMDQTEALQWVQENIFAFGGDPANVTLFGESAGSMSVSAQVASPLTRGLIAKAIGESGSLFAGAPDSQYIPQPREKLEARNARWAENTFGSDHLTYLRSLSTGDLMNAFKSGRKAPFMGPVVDGYFLPDTLEHLYADGKQAHIPLLAGWNANESRTKTPLAETAQTDFGEQAQAFLSAYGPSGQSDALGDSATSRIADDYASDRFIVYATWKWIEAQTKTGGAPVYRYRFELGSPGDRNHPAEQGAFHSDDIEYVFGTLDSRPGVKLRPEDRTLSDQMGRYWTNFARTGDPNGPGLPKWPAYSASHNVMTLDANPKALPAPHENRYQFLDSVWGESK
ncbi:para-nitrobenzyl esterase [Granulicella rosea]|uniref:Carboxylic ester hydrolase n=1 Tax=Granulicella rosea TaxID=474952 RepID=A0A239E051_9BACT|nr:carboxylesterase/lipase family protein [Granulicella rosea]SNS37274.1 para-nitrobenzyl esterase [Granulicella rosea]